MSIKEMVTRKKEWIDWQTNSPCQHLKKRTKNNVDDMHTNVRV